ncbi:MAG: tetratricopeptide repeat protein [Solirubrobacterales bacterium]|nr:tetratricopeptide repeat protein [Solirubrobacterales bacterium]
MTAPPTLTATTVPLHLTVDPWWDLVEVLAFGTDCDGIGASRYETLVEDLVAFVFDEAHETVIGFVVQGWSELEDFEQEDTPLYWDGPRFDVPALGLPSATVGELLVAIRGRFEEGEPTADAMHFHMAMSAPSPAKALPHWQLALEAGDMKAHYSLGYTLYDLDEYHRAYGHLRRYTELAPANAWAWCWYGQACEAVDLPGEARDAYLRAIELDEEEETGADELLDEMGD